MRRQQQAEDVDRLLDGAPIHLVNTDPPYNVKVEPRSQQRHRRRPVVVPGHHASPGLRCRTPPGEGDSRRQEDACQGPAAGERLRQRGGVRPPAQCVVRQLSPACCCRGGGFYIWGGYANIANYPAVLKAARPVLRARRSSGTKSIPVLTRKDFMGDHEWCFLHGVERRRPPVLRTQQRHRPVVHQEGQPADP